MEKIKPKLTGSAETMLQSFYARALYSKKNPSIFYDAKAIEIVEKIDYDFSIASQDNKMNKGVIARSIVFDELIHEYIQHHPDCTVVNIACGLDTRFYRMDNGMITWYNLDLPETIEVRNQLFLESGRVSTIGKSVLDSTWVYDVKVRKDVLFVVEGLSMYLTEEENQNMLNLIYDNFDSATVMMECIAKRWVNKEKVEKSIQKTGAKFVFGADTFEDIKHIASGFHKVKDDNIIRGTIPLIPILKPFQNTKIFLKMTQKILVFEKDNI